MDKIKLWNIKRYKRIDKNMDKGIGVKNFSQKAAIKYIKKL